MTATGELVMPTKIKIKLGTKKFVIDPVSKSCDLEKNMSCANKWDQAISLKEQSSSAVGTNQILVSRSGYTEKVFAADHVNDKSYLQGANKRGPSACLEPQNHKRKKMDRSVTQQCSHILKKLMTHPAGWVFNQPVDPLSLNIPDYFSVITDPMDLGTIKLKLGKNLYYGTGEFVADVRLTFSNAMLYNPASNNVHLMAKELNDLFSKLWNSFDVNWSYESSEADHGQVLNVRATKTIVAKQKKTPSLHRASLPKRSISSEDWQKLRKELCSVLKRNIPSQWRATLQRFGLPSKIDESFELAFDRLDDESYLELRNLTRNFVDATATEVKFAKTIANRNDECLKNFHKGANSDIRHASALTDSRRALSQSSVKCGLCGNATCQCRVDNDSIHESSSDLSSERSLGKDYSSGHGDTFKEIARREIHQCFGPANLSQDSMSVSNGTVSAVDDEIPCPRSHLSTPVVAAVSEEALDIQLSPKRALRAALLKSRFADTILKAQRKTLHHGDQADPSKLQKEKERLEKKQREEKTRIEAEIKAAEAATQMRIEVELKTRREKEREAARIALQMVEKTVEINENIQVIKDLEMLSGFSPSGNEIIAESGSENSGITFLLSPRIGNPLERLGLYMKPEYLGDEEDEDMILNGGGEEGEIIS